MNYILKLWGICLQQHLTNFECEADSFTGNGIAEKCSWNQMKQTKMNLFPAGFSHMEPLWARAGRLRVRLVAFGTYEIFRNALLCVAFTILYSVDRAFSKATLRIYQKTVKLVPTILFFCQLFSRGKPSWLLRAYCNVCIDCSHQNSIKVASWDKGEFSCGVFNLTTEIKT